MARLTTEQKELIVADFHTGQFSQRDLALKYDCSTATINKLTKGLHPKNEEKVNALISIKSDLAYQSEQEVNAVHNIVDEKTKHLIYFQDSALKNQQIANSAISAVENMISESKTQKEKDAAAITGLSIAKDHASITKMNKETVLGKDPDTIINNSNQQQNNNLTLDDFYQEA